VVAAMKKRLEILLIIYVLSGACFAADDLSIGRMQVAIWSEYDDSSVLAIYDGRFQDVTQFPIKTSFLVPNGSIINDACSLPHEGKDTNLSDRCDQRAHDHASFV
jgi:hypothetical protein